MSTTPQASYEAVIAELHSTYGRMISSLVQENAATAAALANAHTELEGAQQALRLAQASAGQGPECEETDFNNRGDCRGPVRRRTVRMNGSWGKLAGEPVNLCLSHESQADPTELDPLPKEPAKVGGVWRSDREH